MHSLNAINSFQKHTGDSPYSQNTEKVEHPRSNTAVSTGPAPPPPEQHAPALPETRGRFTLFQLKKKESTTFWKCPAQSAGVVLLSLWGRDIDGWLCKSLLFLCGRRGAGALGAPWRTAEPDTPRAPWAHSHSTPPTPPPGNGCKNPSLDSVRYGEELPGKIQASKEVEMMTTAGPAIRLGSWLRYGLSSAQGNCCFFKERSRPLSGEALISKKHSKKIACSVRRTRQAPKHQPASPAALELSHCKDVQKTKSR